MGEWLEHLLVEPKYYSTLLPRIPVPIARSLKVKVRAALRSTSSEATLVTRRLPPPRLDFGSLA